MNVDRLENDHSQPTSPLFQPHIEELKEKKVQCKSLFLKPIFIFLQLFEIGDLFFSLYVTVTRHFKIKKNRQNCQNATNFWINHYHGNLLDQWCPTLSPFSTCGGRQLVRNRFVVINKPYLTQIIQLKIKMWRK
jgi:hypothetical protein